MNADCTRMEGTGGLSWRSPGLHRKAARRTRYCNKEEWIKCCPRVGPGENHSGAYDILPALKDGAFRLGAGKTWDSLIDPCN